MQDMTNEIADLVIEFGGSMSGEHGDGLATKLSEREAFRTRIYKAFQR
jgi:FAD linked oxidases, C-terminal domain.